MQDFWQELHGGIQTSQKCQDIFHSYANFNYPFLKIGLCNLFPVLLDCITYNSLKKANEELVKSGGGQVNNYMLQIVEDKHSYYIEDGGYTQA